MKHGVQFNDALFCFIKEAQQCRENGTSACYAFHCKLVKWSFKVWCQPLCVHISTTATPFFQVIPHRHWNLCLKLCPHWRLQSPISATIVAGNGDNLSPNSATVGENGDSRRIRRMSPFSVKFGKFNNLSPTNCRPKRRQSPSSATIVASVARALYVAALVVFNLKPRDHATRALSDSVS